MIVQRPRGQKLERGKAAPTYRVDLRNEVPHRRLQHSVHHVTHQVLQAVQEIVECQERALSLYMGISMETTGKYRNVSTEDGWEFHL